MAKFIVIDGLDGCGKATQVELLGQKLSKMGKRVIKLDFPNYESDSSAAIRMYLKGEIGDNTEVLNPYMCSTFYAVDRFIQFEKEIRRYFNEDDNTVIISDRYVSANIIHQGAKIESDEERKRFNKWVYDFECNLCGLPEDDITIILTLKPEVSHKLLLERYNENSKMMDIHENNINYLNNCYNKLQSSIDNMTENGRKWYNIQCQNDNNGVKTREEIYNLIMQVISDNNIL